MESSIKSILVRSGQHRRRRRALKWITARLDYFIWLGVNVIWISPVYPSPMADFGYDVSDYWRINPPFGTFVDFDRLLAEAHRRQLKINFVPNHTSDRHPWFEESRLSRGSASVTGISGAATAERHDGLFRCNPRNCPRSRDAVEQHGQSRGRHLQLDRKHPRMMQQRYPAGDDGNNILTGGLGADTLKGNAESGTFVFSSTSGSLAFACDTITDLLLR